MTEETKEETIAEKTTGSADMTEETKEETIKRLLESRSHLWWSMIKFGKFTKCHSDLFRRIDDHLLEIGCVMYE